MLLFLKAPFSSWKYLKECVWLPKIADHLYLWAIGLYKFVSMQQMYTISWYYTGCSFTGTIQILGVLFLEKWNSGIKQMKLFFSLIRFPDSWEPVASAWLTSFSSKCYNMFFFYFSLHALLLCLHTRKIFFSSTSY